MNIPKDPYKELVSSLMKNGVNAEDWIYELVDEICSYAPGELDQNDSYRCAIDLDGKTLVFNVEIKMYSEPAVYNKDIDLRKPEYTIHTCNIIYEDASTKTIELGLSYRN
jgi:hypothetical protein